jgi:hypothetical protein
VPDRVSDRLGPFTLRGVRAGGQALTVRVGPGGDVSVEARDADPEPVVASSRDTP